MNKENASQFLPLVQALAEGKTIQWRNDPEDAWTDYMDGETLSFSDSLEDYRIKPGPREFMISLSDDERVVFHSPQPHGKAFGDSKPIRVREILD